MKETQQSTKLEGHIESLQDKHDQLDKQILNEYIKFGDDAAVNDMKKRKLQLKDEIEKLRKELDDMDKGSLRESLFG